jgi:tetratricopeptide (TPR) repeat protein
VFAALLTGPAMALAAVPSAASAPGKAAAPQTDQAHPAGKALDGLFVALAAAESSEQAKPIEAQILARFLQSGSPSIDLLMHRAGAALKSGDVKTAKKLLSSITAIEPDFAEGWHQRARLEAVVGEDQAAMVNLERTITLNPRQFQATAELAQMLEDYGNKPAALKLYRKAMALDPHLSGVARQVRKLTREVEGERI